MNPFFYDYPFLFFQTGGFCFGFKPFVPIFAVYFLLTLCYLHAFTRHRTEAETQSKIWKRLERWWKENLTRGERGFILAYPFLLLFYLFQRVSGGDGTFLTELAKNYLRYETPLFCLALILRLVWIRGRKGLWKQAQIADRAVGLMAVGSVFATIITRQVDSCVVLNILCFFVLGTFAFVMEYQWRRKPALPAIVNKDIFRPVETYRQLLPQQRRVADEIISMICGNCAESSASICVSGEWGVGKTSVVNGAIDELKRKDKAGGGKRRDECIYINAMELDTLSSLFDYFFSRIRGILKKRGAYVGLGSEYQKFISASIGKITDPSVAAFLESRLFPSSDDYRERLKSLEESIYAALDGDLILVVVDDVERCEEKKARSFIAFIKEIATMRGIVTIFITDFKYLSAPKPRPGSTGADEAEKESGFYYDKFFNYRISVPPIDAEEFMERKDGEAPRKKLRGQLGLRPAGDVFLSFEEKLALAGQRGKEKQAQSGGEAAERAGEMDRPENLFGNVFGLPRTLSKFYLSLDQNLKLLKERYVRAGGLDDDTKAYFEDIRLNEVLFFISFLQSCVPDECRRVMEQGLEYFERKGAEVSAHHRLVIALGEGVLYQYSSFLGVMSQSYHQSKAWQFALLCLENKLPESVKSFDSKEEEWFAGIEGGDLRLMEEYWPDMVSAAAQILPWKDPERGERCLNRLFSFGRQKLDSGEWDLGEIFRIFDHQWRNEGTFSQRIPVLRLFWEQFSGSLGSAKREDIQLLNHFSEQYLYYRAESVVPAACLLIPLDEKWEQTNKLVQNKVESVFSGHGSEGEKLDAMLDRLFPYVINIELPHMDDAFARLDALAGQAEARLAEDHLDEYADMRDIIDQLRLTAEEFRYLEKIKGEAIGPEASGADRYLRHVDLEDMDGIIRHLQRLAGANDPGEADRLQNDLQLFLNELRPSQYSLSEEQYQALQEVLTRCRGIFGRMPVLYRMILAEHRRLGREDGTSPAAGESCRP